MRRVTTTEYYDFVAMYNRNHFPYLRFGQAFIKHFNGDRSVSDARLFYERDRKAAEDYIWKYYVDKSF